MMLVLSLTLLVCLSWVGLTEAGICSSSSSPGYIKVDNENEESIDGFKKSTEKRATSEDEVLPLPTKPVTSKEVLLFETKSVLKDEKYFNGFLIEISVVILLVVVLCIICSILLIIKKKARGGVIHQLNQEGQQLEFHHQEAELHQGVLRPYSARTYQPRSARTPTPLPQRPDSPYPGGDAAFRHMNAGLLTDTEDVDQDDYLHSYYEAHGQFRNCDVDFSRNQEGQHFDFHYQEAELHQGVLRPYSARTYQPLSALTPHPLPPRPDSPYPGGNAAFRHMNSRLLTDTEDVHQDDYLLSYDDTIGRFINFDIDFSQNQEGQQFDFHHQEPELYQGVVHPYSARTYRSQNAHPPHHQVTHFTSLPYCPDPPPTYPGPPGGDVAYPQLLADTEDVDVDDHLPSYDEAVG